MTEMITVMETSYQGYLFRSRTEARWAVFFDALGIKWEYEKEGYNLTGLRKWYLPDFWLPEINLFAEVKPDDNIADKDRERMEYFDNHAADGLIYLIGAPSEWTVGDQYQSSAQLVTLHCDIHDWQHISYAITAAKSARFEHGQKPNIRNAIPVLDLSGILDRATCTIAELDRHHLKRTVKLVGEILTIQIFKDKKGYDMARIKIADTTGICTLMIFSMYYGSLKHRIREGNVVIAAGKVGEYNEELQLYCEALQCINVPKPEPVQWTELGI